MAIEFVGAGVVGNDQHRPFGGQVGLAAQGHPDGQVRAHLASAAGQPRAGDPGLKTGRDPGEAGGRQPEPGPQHVAQRARAPHAQRRGDLVQDAVAQEAFEVSHPPPPL